MMGFLAENIGTILAAFILTIIVSAIIIKLKKDKRSGRSSCSCGCGGCPNSARCHGRSIKK